CLLALLLGLRHVQPLEVQGEAGGRQGPAEAAHELVVAAAAAEDVPERRVVDLDDRAGVVAEVAQEAEVELDALGDAALAQELVGGANPAQRLLDDLTAELDRPPEHLRAAAQLREPEQGLAL